MSLVPGLPSRVDVTKPTELRRALEQILEQMRVWQGLGPRREDQVVTVGAAGDLLDPNELGDPALDRTPPPQPTNLVASAGVTSVVLTWDFPTYPQLAYFEVWRAAEDNLATAVMIARSFATIHSDPIGPDAAFYYWVRAVSAAEVPGPYNATAGTLGQTSADPGWLLDLLEGSITESQLYQALNERINLLDGPDSLAGSVAARIKAEADARIAAINSIETDVSGLQADVTTLQAQVADLSGTPSFDSGTAYGVDDLVTYNGGLYRCIQATTPPSPDPSNAAYWQKIGDYASLGDAVAAHALQLADHETRIDAAEGTLTAHTSQITALAAGLSDAEGDIGANASAISALDTRVTSAEGTITTHSSQISALDTRLTTAEGGVVANAGAISALDTRVTSAEGTIDAYSTQLATLNTRLTTAEDEIDANAGAISALDTRVTSAEGAIGAHATQLTALDARVSAAEGDIGTIEGVNAAQATAIAGLETRVTATEGAISAHSTELTTLDSRLDAAEGDLAAQATALSGLDTRVTAAEGAISAHSTELTALDSRLDAAEGAVSAHGTAISQLDTRVAAAEGTIASHSSSITSLDSRLTAAEGENTAQASAISVLDTRVTAAEGTINSHASSISALIADVDANEAAIVAEQTARASADSALTTSLNALSASVPGTAMSAAFVPSLAWEFRSSLDGFTVAGATTTQNTDSFTLTSAGTDPRLVRSGLAINGGQNPLLRMRVRRLSGSGWQGSVYYTTGGHGESSSYYKTIPLPANLGQWQVLEWDMAALTAGGMDWTSNTITGIRFDLGTTPQDVFEIDWIAVGKIGVDPVLNQGVFAAINAEAAARASADSAMASDIVTLQAGVANNTTAIAAEQIARADADSALSSQVTTLQTTVNGFSTAIQQHTTAIDGLKAQYTLKIDNNGFVSGFGLASESVDGVPFSEFYALADRFAIINPNTSPLVVTSITRSGSTATVTTQVAHGLTTGAYVVMTGAAQKEYNGTKRVTVLNATQFSYPVTGAPTTPATAASGFPGLRAGVARVPFIVDNGAVYLDTASIREGTIGRAHIGLAAIDDARIANLNAAKINAGTLAAERLATNIAYIRNQAMIGNAVIQSAHIQDAAVETLKLAGQAVTIPVGAHTATQYSECTTSYPGAVIQSVSLTSTGAPVQVIASFGVRNPTLSGQLYYFRIRRNGVIIFDLIDGVEVLGPLSPGERQFNCVGISDTPGAGAVTYELLFQANTNCLAVSKRSLIALETKR